MIVEPGGLVVGRVHDRDDVRMPDARGQLRLADEALRQRRVVHRQGRGKDLERHLDLERLVRGQVNRAHAAAAQLADGPATSDDVAGLNFSDEWGHEHSFS